MQKCNNESQEKKVEFPGKNREHSVKNLLLERVEDKQTLTEIER